MNEQQMLISSIISLAGTIAAMGLYIVHLHGKNSRASKENADSTRELLVSMIDSSTKTAVAIENNNQLVSKMLNKL